MSNNKWMILLVCFLSFYSSSIYSEEIPVKIDIFHEKNMDPSILKICMYNHSKDPIVLLKQLLPWGNRYSISMNAKKIGVSGEKLKMAFPIDDPTSDRIILHESEFMCGEIDLNFFFKNFDVKIANSRILINWSYVLVLADGAAFKGVSGSLVVDGGEWKNKRHAP